MIIMMTHPFLPNNHRNPAILNSTTPFLTSTIPHTIRYILDNPPPLPPKYGYSPLLKNLPTPLPIKYQGHITCPTNKPISPPPWHQTYCRRQERERQCWREVRALPGTLVRACRSHHPLWAPDKSCSPGRPCPPAGRGKTLEERGWRGNKQGHCKNVGILVASIISPILTLLSPVARGNMGNIE